METPDNNGTVQPHEIIIKRSSPASPVVDAMLKSPRCSVDLTWKDLCVTVEVAHRSNFFVSLIKTTRPRKLVLNNVSGIARAGTLTAILGPSGAGKTTLLAALSNRMCGDIRGDIRINGWPADENILRLSTFIPQQNLFIDTLTACEHLEFMVGLRFPTSTDDDRRYRVHELLKEMGLEPNCAISSLSAGERKRLTFASEIVTDPPLLFVDEVTTNLDSHTAHTIVSLLQLLASRGRTIICSIHQPSSKVFEAFNHLILMADGRVAFSGNNEDAQKFFKDLGYPSPRNYNPADFYIQTLAGPKETEKRRVKHVHKICDNFASSQQANQLASDIKRLNDATFLSSYSHQFDGEIKGTTVLSSEWRQQIRWLTWRSFLDSLRNPTVHLIRTVHKVMTSILIALCFAGAGVDLNQKSIQDIEGALFIFLTENNFPSCYAVLNVFPPEIPIFLQEQRQRLYRSDTYYVSKILSLLPGFIIEPFLFTTIAYWIIGLRPDVYAFFVTALIIIMTANVACAYGCFLSTAFESVETSTVAMMPINQIIMVSAGFYVNIRTIPIYLNWVKNLSWMLYSNEALTILQWVGIDSIACESKEGRRGDLPCIKSGQEVISRLGFQEDDLSWDLTILALMFCGLHLAGFVCLWFRSRSALRRRHPVSTDYETNKLNPTNPTCSKTLLPPPP